MTVKELIERLQQWPDQNAKVQVFDYGGCPGVVRYVSKLGNGPFLTEEDPDSEG